MEVIMKNGMQGELNFEEKEGAAVFRHTASHILAQAVKRLYPDAKLAIGPAIDDGFYYDFDFSSPISSDDFAAIEKVVQILKLPNYPQQFFFVFFFLDEHSFRFFSIISI